MRNQPLPLIGQAYTDDAHPWAMQDVVNWLPCAAETEGTRTATMCKTPPGLAPFVETSVSAPVRGLYNGNGRLFGVIGPTFYEFSPSGVAIPRGTVGGASRVRMAHNQLTHGNEVVIVNGSSGYLYNTQTQTFAAISDDGYPGGIDAVFVDGYFVQIEPARRFAFNSDLASGGDYNTLDRFTSEVSPDLLVGLAAPNNELILFSETSAEFFENTGAAQQPFRSKRISIKRGAASRYGQAELDNTVFWLGNDGKFYVLEGYTPRRISTRPIEQAIRGLNWAQAFAFIWESEGHAVVYWTFPDGRTWGYDASQGRWHRRASLGLDRWRVNATAFWEDRWIAGDFQTGRLWELDWAYPWEGQTEFVSEVVAPVIHDHQNRVLMPRLEVLMDVGQPEVDPREFPAQPTGPTMTGAAPDGMTGEAYTFTYTLTPGDAPIISALIRSGTLLAGLEWDELTGTISGTPTETGTMDLTFRVTDTNGLFDDHADTIVMDYRYDFVSGGATAVYFGQRDGTWTDYAAAAVESGAMLVTWGHRVIALGPTTVTYSDDYFATSHTVTPPWAGTANGRALKTASGRLYYVTGDANVYSSGDGAATWETFATAADTLSLITGDSDALIAVDVIDAGTAHLYRSTTGASFPFLSAVGGVSAAGFGDGMFLLAGLFASAARWSDDACDSFTNVTTPSPGGDQIESYCAFRTSSGAWLLSNRGTDPAALIARSPDGEDPFAYVTAPTGAQWDGTFTDVFAERAGVVVAPMGYGGGGGIALIFAHSADFGATWVRHDHAFPGGPGMVNTIAAFPTGAAK